MLYFIYTSLFILINLALTYYFIFYTPQIYMNKKIMTRDIIFIIVGSLSPLILRNYLPEMPYRFYFTVTILFGVTSFLLIFLNFLLPENLKLKSKLFSFIELLLAIGTIVTGIFLVSQTTYSFDKIKNILSKIILAVILVWILLGIVNLIKKCKSTT
ncbi:hypothetical protein GF322_03010 [Candidatus Dependentiae bacterium]|nr:hypothetical protein [Candidatus Dependentiae bacterium]